MGTDALPAADAAYGRRAWSDACADYRAVSRRHALPPAAFDRWAVAAYLTGARSEAERAWESAHHEWLEIDRPDAATRSAFWLGLTLVLDGEPARGGGWLGRAGRLLERVGTDSPEAGLLRIPAAVGQLSAKDHAGALATFRQAEVLAARSGDPDLYALSRLGGGQALVAAGEWADGLAVLDEAMAAAMMPEVCPIAAGIVYCAVILACRQAFDLGRAHEWTLALDRWCADQQDLSPYRGQCLVHRSQVLQVSGFWTQALAEVDAACQHLADPPGDPVQGMAWYQRAELCRLRGDFAEAEDAFAEASRWGHPVQPGLALLRLAEGRRADARAALRRVVVEATELADRGRLLGGFVEVSLAVDDTGSAREAVTELHQLAARYDSIHLRAVAQYGEGTVSLAEGDPTAACAALGRAKACWQELGARYEIARTAAELARAYLQVEDRDTAAMESAAARATFAELNARPDLERLDAGLATSLRPDPLTVRQREVLCLVATGSTNREVATALVISEHTVRRHLQNIFTRLDLSTRAAATAYAHRHHLL